MIEVSNLIKTFKRDINEKEETAKSKKRKKTQESFNAVNDVSITANDGEILGVLGPNGAGKTTLLRMMACLTTPDSGEVTIIDKKDDRVITDPIEIKRNIGYLSENTKLYQRFSPREMLKVFGSVYGMTKEEIDERISLICDVLKMDEFIDNKIGVLSTGQTQKVNIARCLMHNPSNYIFDEPTLGLDIITSESIIQFMKEERDKGKAILYSTHYMEEAQYLCDRIVLLYQGKIIDSGTPESLMEKYDSNNLRDTFKDCINNR